MPKTSAKKSSKSKLDWLKPNTPAKGLLLFVLVFAVAGGGYYAYKSNAASLTVFADKMRPIMGATLTKDTTSTNKSGQTVYALSQGDVTGRGAGSVTTDITLATAVAYKMRACATVRFASPTTAAAYTNMGLRFQPTNDPTGTYKQITIKPSTDYAKYCTEYVPASFGGNVLVSNFAYSPPTASPIPVPATLNVFSISLEY